MRNQTYDILWKKLHVAAKNERLLLRVMFELTYRCNFSCLHCYVPSRYKSRKELDTKSVFSLLDQLKKIGCFYLGFTGGEPFARRDINDIMWHAKQLGFVTMIYTNGSLIDRFHARELVRIKPNRVDITVPGFSKPVFEKISGVVNSRDRVFKVIRYLREKGVTVGIKSCVLESNYTELDKIRHFAESLHIPYRLDTLLSYRLDGSREPFRYKKKYSAGGGISFPETETTVCRNADSLLSTGSMEHSLFKCGVGFQQAAITPDGKMKMCLMIDYPRYPINDSNLSGQWERMRALIDSIQPGQHYQCASCYLYEICLWCPARAWLYKKNFTSCDPVCRSHAMRFKEDIFANG